LIHIHIDVDDLWIYAAEYGVRERDLTESVYAEALPRFLELLAERGAKATFFLVGRDLERPVARSFCVEAVAQGHELANHTYSHSTGFHALAPAAKEDEIVRAEAAVTDAAGVEPVGFRAPGYYLDGHIVEILARRGYLYDSSILPSFVQPLFKLYIRLRSGERIDKQFGTARSSLASQGVRRVTPSRSASGWLYELPVSVLPALRIPVHSTFSFQLPPSLRDAVYAVQARRQEQVFLFHAVDATGRVESELLRRRVLPLRLDATRRLEGIRRALALAEGRASITTREYLAGLDPSGVRRSRILRWS
jgi:peptidoglycan/xylan/chitin deacetylase (PgdA/CDA1 family)